MFHWLRELLEIKYEFREKRTKLTREVEVETKVCQSCETLKQQLEIANYEKQQLLNRLLKEPEKEPERTVAPEPVSRPRMVPWHVRQQMLEREDREKARALRNAPKPDSVPTTVAETPATEEAENAAFEKELKDAEAAREAASRK